MSDNQYLEIIENKIDDITKLVEQQSKSGAFFDGFTKQVLEKIHNQLEYISNFESNEMISYLTEEMNRTLEERHVAIQQRLDGVQSLINNIQANLTDSLKSPEMHQVFTQISENILEFSRDLNAQTKYFNSTVENIQSEIGKIKLDDKFEEQASFIRTEVNNYKISLNSLSADINSSFDVLKKLIENSAPSETLVAMSGDISVVQKGMNDIVNAVMTLNNKQGDLLDGVARLSMNLDNSDIKAEVSSMLAEMQAVKEAVKILVNKSDIEALNEKLNFAIETVSNLKELAAFNDGENKTVFRTYFNDLTNLLGSLVSKEEGEYIKNKIEFFQVALETGKQDIREIINNSNDELRNIVPLISSLSTKENVQELSENTIRSLTELTDSWTQQFTQQNSLNNERMEVVKHALSNIYETLSNISSKVDSVSMGQGGFAVKEELDAILNHVNDMSGQVAASTHNSIKELVDNLSETSNLIASRTNGLEQIIFASQDNIKSSLSGSVDELKEVSQNLVNIVADFNNQLEDKTDEIKSVLNERYENLSKKVNDLSALYLTSSLENKEQVMNSIDMLRDLIEASKASLDNNGIFNSINDKLGELEVFLHNEKDTLLQSIDAINNQSNRIDELNNSIRDIFDNFPDIQRIASENKDEIKNTIDEKLNGVFDNFAEAQRVAYENKDEIKNAIDEKLNGVFDNFSDVQRIAYENKDEIKANVNERYDDLCGKVNDLAEAFKQSSVENKSQILETIENLRNVIGATKSALNDNDIFDSFNNKIEELNIFLRNEKDTLIQSIDAINNQSMRIDELNNSIKGIFDNFSDAQRIAYENKDEIKSAIDEKLNGVFDNFSDTQRIANENKEEIKNDIKNAIDEKLNGVFDNFSDVQRVAYENKEEIKNAFNENLKGVFDNFSDAQRIANENKDELKSILYERYDELNKKVNEVSALFLTSSLENKSDIINNFDSLRAVVEESKVSLDNDGIYNLINDKINDLEALLRDNQDSLVSSSTQVAETMGRSIDLLEVMSNSIKELSANISDARLVALSNKEEIISELSQKVYSVTALIEDAKNIISDNFEGNKIKLQEDFSELRTSTDEIKSILNEVSQNQAGKEILAAILENVTGKLAEVTEIINADKDVTSEQFEMVKQLTEALKTDLSNIVAHLNQSADFAQNLLNRMSAGFVETTDNLVKQTTLLKNAIAEVSTEEKTEILQKAEILSGQLVNLQNTVSGLNFDESVKEQLVSLKQQIEMFNQQSLGDIFNRINENDIQTGQKIEEITAEIKASFVDALNKIDSLNIQADDLQNTIVATLAQNLDEINQKFENFAENLKTNSYENKDQILGEIAELKASTNELYTGVSAVNEKIPQREFIVEQTDRINNVINQFSETINAKLNEINDNDKGYVTSAVKEAFVELQEQISESINYLKGLNLNLDRSLDTTKNAILESVDVLKETSSKSLDAVNVAKNEIIANVSDNTASLKSDFDSKLQDTFEKFNEKIAFLTGSLQTDSSANKETFINTINELKDSLDNNFTEFQANEKQALESVNEFVKNEISEKLQKSNEEITSLTEKITENAQKTEAFGEEVKQLIGTTLAQVNETLSNGNASASEFQENVKVEIKKSIDEITTKLFQYDEGRASLREDLIFELQKTYNILNEKLDNQAEKTNNVVNEIAEKIDFTDLKGEILKETLENKDALVAKIEDLANEISANKELFKTTAQDNKDDIIEQIFALKAEVLSVQPEEDASSADVVAQVKAIAEKIEGISDDILDALSNDIDASFTDNFKTITETIEDKISFIKDDVQEVVLKISEIDSVVERVKDVVVAEFDEYLQSLDSKFDNLSEDIKNYVDASAEKITSAIEEYQKELNSLSDIDLKTYNEDTRVFVEEQIAQLKDKLEELKAYKRDNNDTVVTITEIMNNSVDTITNSVELVQDEIKDTLNEINEKTQGISAIVKDGNASLKDVIERYQESVKALSNIDLPDTQSDASQEFIKDELKHVKEQLIRSLASVFENISFIEEAEEIQNAIYDNTDYLKDEIANLKQELIANSNSTADTDAKFNNLKSILESITTGVTQDSEKYIYTLPDVETDIAKMRMAINDITKMLQDSQNEDNEVAERLGSIDDIREDISSISKRTNKLILTSDEANKNLREHLAEFRAIMTEVNEKCNTLDSRELKQNLADSKAMLMSNLKSSQVLNEAFMHFAEWIDESSKTINEISSQVDDNKDNIKTIKNDINNIEEKTNDLKTAVSDLTSKFDRKFSVDYSKYMYDIECALDKINDKLEVQELKMKSLEKKVENASNGPASAEELSSVLEFIASQVTVTNENTRANKMILQKLEMLELKMEQFESSIEKITEFVDGAN